MKGVAETGGRASQNAESDDPALWATAGPALPAGLEHQSGE